MSSEIESINEPISWLLKGDKTLQPFFLGLLLTGFGVGATRLLLPFTILETGGTEALLSVSSVWFAIGQLLAYLLLSRVIRSIPGLGGNIFLLTTCFLGVVIISPSPDLLAAIRLLEGIVLGLMFLLILKVSKQYSKREAEVIGTLLGGVFVGLALGQGFAGVMEMQVELWMTQTQLMAIRIVFLIISFPSILGAGLIVFSTRPFSEPSDTEGHRSGHAHLSQILRCLAIPGFLMLGAIYVLYDFSHGLYTPTLSIMLNENGISLGQLGLAYLIGDFTWGVVQIIAGKLVDHIGAILPLTGSLIVKGLLVFFYPQADIFLMAASLLMMAGMAEGFLEPARNKKAVELEGVETLEHSHRHWNIVFGPTTGFEVSQHMHNHTHHFAAEDAVALLQSIGIVAFALGSLVGAFFLSTGSDFVFLTQLGGLILMTAALPALLFRFQGSASIQELRE